MLIQLRQGFLLLDIELYNNKDVQAISRFDILASGIGFDLNTRLLRPGLVESTCRAHMRSDR